VWLLIPLATVALAALFAGTMAFAAGKRSQWATSTTGGSFVVNGDFSAGNSGFTTNYVNSSSLLPPETYAVGANPNAFNSAWPTMGDHTTGTGLMMIVNGATTGDQTVWSETVAVTPNHDL
jgi:hypothetical protein